MYMLQMEYVITYNIGILGIYVLLQITIVIS